MPPLQPPPFRRRHLPVLRQQGRSPRQGPPRVPTELRCRLEPDGPSRRRRRARSHAFDEKTLRLSLAEIARNSYGDGTTVNQALEEGWKRGVGHAMADGILTQTEETKLREFRNRLALADSGTDRQATARLDKASRDRLTLDARLAAVAVDDPDAHLNGLAQSLRDSGLTQGQQTAILVRAWEAAVEGALEDGLITLDEENALNRYMDHFGLTQFQMDRNGVLTQVVKAAVIRDVTEGIVPDRQNIHGRALFNLMKSEKLVWVMTGVDYLEVVTRRERRGKLPRAQHPGGEGCLLPPRDLPEQERRVGGDGPPGPPDSSGSPPSTSTSPDRGRNSGSGTTGSWTSSRSTTGSG